MAPTADGSGGGASGVVRIDYAQIDAAIGVFQSALDRLEPAVLTASQAIEPSPVAGDQVSGDASTVFTRTANPAARSWTGAVQELRSMIRQLQASKAAQQDADETNSQPMSTGL